MCQRTRPPAMVAIRKPMVARRSAGLGTDRNSSYRMLIVVSKRRGGRTKTTNRPPGMSPVSRLTLRRVDSDELAMMRPKKTRTRVYGALALLEIMLAASATVRKLATTNSSEGIGTGNVPVLDYF